MSRFSGPQHRGALRLYRQAARFRAEERQAFEHARDAARARESRRALAEWQRTLEARAARRFWRDFERRLGARLAA